MRLAGGVAFTLLRINELGVFKVETSQHKTSSVETIPAREGCIGGHYLTRNGRRVIVRSKTTEKVVLWSAATDHLVAVPLDYPLIPVWETLFSSEGSTC